MYGDEDERGEGEEEGEAEGTGTRERESVGDEWDRGDAGQLLLAPI